MQIKISSWHIKVLPNCFHFVTSPHQFNKLLHSHIKFKVTLSNKIKIDNSTEPTNKEHKHYMQSKPRVVKKILRHYIQNKPSFVKKILRHYCTLHAEQIQGCQKDFETLLYITCRAIQGCQKDFEILHYMLSKSRVVRKILRHWTVQQCRPP